MVCLRILAAIAVVGSFAWLIAAPGFEPALAAVGAISALVSTFLSGQQDGRRAEQQQSVSTSSIGVQAAGDVKIHDRGNDNHVR